MSRANNQPVPYRRSRRVYNRNDGIKINTHTHTHSKSTTNTPRIIRKLQKQHSQKCTLSNTNNRIPERERNTIHQAYWLIYVQAKIAEQQINTTKWQQQTRRVSLGKNCWIESFTVDIHRHIFIEIRASIIANRRIKCGNSCILHIHRRKTKTKTKTKKRLETNTNKSKKSS